MLKTPEGAVNVMGAPEGQTEEIFTGEGVLYRGAKEIFVTILWQPQGGDAVFLDPYGTCGVGAVRLGKLDHEVLQMHHVVTFIAVFAGAGKFDPCVQGGQRGSK